MPTSDPPEFPPLESVFTPGAPVTGARHIGRPQRLERATHVLDEPGRHLLVLGEAGVGRTSFALACAGVRPHRYHQLGLDDRFELLMRRLLEPPDDHADAVAGGWELVDGKARAPAVLILDDVDRAPPEAISGGITPLLRALADTGSTTKLILTARRDRPFPDTLAGAGLRLYAIGLERLDEVALAEIVDGGARATGVRFQRELRDRIVLDADGLPGMVHALCLEAGRSAEARGSKRVTLGRDYLPALTNLVDSLAPRLRSSYEAATESRGHSNRFAHLLWAGALCQGASFDLGELERVLAQIEGKAVPQQAYVRHLGDLIKRGLFARIREGLYRFTDPAMRVYIRLRLRKEEPTLMGEAALQLALPY
ncbi:MAG: hypothetical protein ABI333_15150 [bacterium]